MTIKTKISSRFALPSNYDNEYWQLISATHRIYTLLTCYTFQLKSLIVSYVVWFQCCRNELPIFVVVT